MSSSNDLVAADGADVYRIRLLSGSGNFPLAEKVAQELGIPLEPATIGRFADGECNISLHENVRGSDVYVIQPTCPPGVNDNLMELLLLLSTLKLSSARRVTAIIPYYGYARQDRKTSARVPISAAAVAQLIESMGPHRVVILDLHCGQIQGFFRAIPVDNLYAENELIERISDLNIPREEMCVVSPDAGGVPRARRVADKIGASNVVTILKRRVTANQVDSMQLVGEVSGKYCFIFDDMLDTAGTLCKAANLLRESGALVCYGCITHGLLSGPAVDRINASCIEKLYVTDSISQEEKVKQCPKLEVVSIAPLLSEAIFRLHHEKSLSKLFETSSSVRKHQREAVDRGSKVLDTPKKK